MAITLAKLQKFAKLTQMMSQAKDQRDEIRDEILEEYTTKTSVVKGNAHLSVSPSVKLNTSLFAKEYPEEEYPEYYKSAVDTTKVPDDLKKKFSTTTWNVKVDLVDVEE